MSAYTRDPLARVTSCAGYTAGLRIRSSGSRFCRFVYRHGLIKGCCGLALKVMVGSSLLSSAVPVGGPWLAMDWSTDVDEWRLWSGFAALNWAILSVLVVRAWWWIDRQMSMTGAYGKGSQLLTEQYWSCWLFVYGDEMIDRCRWVALMVRVRSSLLSNTVHVGCPCLVMDWTVDIAKWR